MAFVFVVQTGHASAATISVAPSAVDQTTNGNCSMYEAAEAASTDAAVDNCTAGSGSDTINLPDGTYVLDSNFAFTLTDGVLNGTSTGGTIIDANGSGIGVGSGSVTVTIQNLTIADAYRALDISGQDADITMDNVVIDGGKNGPYIQSGQNTIFTMTNSIIRNLSSADSGDFAMRLSDMAAVNLDGVVVYGNTYTAEVGTGIVEVRGVDISAQDVQVYDNQASGGSIFTMAGRTVLAIDIVVRDNNAGGDSGAGFAVSSYDNGAFSANVSRVAVVRNQVSGGLVAGIFCDTNSTSCLAVMYNVTIANNTSLYPALFINNRDEHPTLGTLENITVANNVRTGSIGGPAFPGALLVLSQDAGQPTMTVQNVLLAHNLDEATERNCVPAGNPFYNLVSLGNNISSDATCASMFNQSSDLNNTDPLIDDLTEDNGTWVLPLLPGSPAINTGGTVGVEVDQRGISRPQGSAYDIGAYEVLGDSTPDPDTGSGSGNGGNAGASQTGTVPGVPNTGFHLLANNPLAVLGLTSVSAGTILIISRRASRKGSPHL